MENKAMQITDSELLGRILDGRANESARRMVILNLVDPFFKEYFMIALRATKLLNDKMDMYETIQ